MWLPALSRTPPAASDGFLRQPCVKVDCNEAGSKHGWADDYGFSAAIARDLHARCVIYMRDLRNKLNGRFMVGRNYMLVLSIRFQLPWINEKSGIQS